MRANVAWSAATIALRVGAAIANASTIIAIIFTARRAPTPTVTINIALQCLASVAYVVYFGCIEHTATNEAQLVGLRWRKVTRQRDSNRVVGADQFFNGFAQAFPLNAAKTANQVFSLFP